MTQEQANWEWMDARVKVLEAYVADLEKGLESSLNLNKAQATRGMKELTDEEILEIWRENSRVYPMDRSRLLDRSRACIKKASEK